MGASRARALHRPLLPRRVPVDRGAARRLRRARSQSLPRIGLLLGAQGLVGWIMVASGLEPGMTAVAPAQARAASDARLPVSSRRSLWRSCGSAARCGRRRSAATRDWAARLLVLLAFVQIALGGLVAGHDAGLTYNSWPLMDGRFIPRWARAARAGLAQRRRQCHDHPVQPPHRRLCADRGDPRLCDRDRAQRRVRSRDSARC